MGKNSVKNYYYEKLKVFLDRYIRNGIYQFQNSTGYN